MCRRQGTESVEKVLLEHFHRSADCFSKSGHVDKWHDGVDVLVEEIDACWDKVEVARTCGSKLIGGKDAIRFVSQGMRNFSQNGVPSWLPRCW